MFGLQYGVYFVSDSDGQGDPRIGLTKCMCESAIATLPQGVPGKLLPTCGAQCSGIAPRSCDFGLHALWRGRTDWHGLRFLRGLLRPLDTGRAVESRLSDSDLDDARSTDGGRTEAGEERISLAAGAKPP